jgi:tetratricopeptide (TPR) repeat protein
VYIEARSQNLQIAEIPSPTPVQPAAPPVSALNASALPLEALPPAAAIASIEANQDALGWLDRLQPSLLKVDALLESVIQSQDGKPRKAFVRFHGDTTGAATWLAMDTLMTWLDAEPSLGCDRPQVGLDLVAFGQSNPLAGVTERSLAKPGSLVMSEAAYHALVASGQLGPAWLEQHPLLPLGPVALGGKQAVFYEVSSPMRLLNPGLVSHSLPAALPSPTSAAIEKDAPVEPVANIEDLPWEFESATAITTAPESRMETALSLAADLGLLAATPAQALAAPDIPTTAPEPIDTSQFAPPSVDEAPPVTDEEIPTPLQEDTPETSSPLAASEPSPEEWAPLPPASAQLDTALAALVSDTDAANNVLEATPETIPPAPPLPSDMAPSPASQDPTPVTQPGQSASDPLRPPLPALDDVLPAFWQEASLPPLRLPLAQALEQLTQKMQGFLNTSGTNSISGAAGQIVFIRGEDGLGKSSLYAQARQRADGNPEQPMAIWVGGEPAPGLLGFWTDVCLQLLGLPPGPLSAEQLNTHWEGMTSHIGSQLASRQQQALPPHAEAIRQGLELLLGVQSALGPTGFPQQSLLPLADVLATWLGWMSLAYPVVLCVDDAHRLDLASLDVLSALLPKLLPTCRVMVVLGLPPNVSPTGVLAGVLASAPTTDLCLAPLGNAELVSFLKGTLLAGMDPIPPGFLQDLATHSEGYPFALEELLRWSFAQGAFATDAQTGEFRLPDHLDPPEAMAKSRESGPLLSRLGQLLGQRFLQMPENTRRVAQLAVAINALEAPQATHDDAIANGASFSVPWLMHIALGMMGTPGEAPQESDIVSLQNELRTLWEQGFLSLDSPERARFRHRLLAHVVWQSVDAPMGLAMRTQVLQYIPEQHFLAAAQLAPRLALLAQQAPDMGIGFETVCEAWYQSAAVMMVLGVRPGTLLALQAAQAVLPPNAEEKDLELRQLLARLTLETKPALAAQLLEWVASRWQALGNAERAMESAGLLALACEKTGQLERKLQALKGCSQWFPSPSQAPWSLASDISATLWQLGRIGELQQRPEPQTIADNPQEQLAQQQWQCTQASVGLHHLDATCAEPLERVAQWLAPQPHVRPILALRLQYAWTQLEVLLEKGQYPAAQQLLDQTLEAIEQVSQAEGLEPASGDLGQWGLAAVRFHCALGEWDHAATLLPNCMDQLEASGDVWASVQAHVLTGRTAWGLKRWQEALQTLEQGILASSDNRFAGLALLGWQYLAQVQTDLGFHQEALDIVENALTVGQQPALQNPLATARLTLVGAQARLALGDVRGAGKQLEPLWQSLQKSAWLPLQAETAGWVGLFYLALSHDTMDRAKQEQHLARAQSFIGKAQRTWHTLGNTWALAALNEKWN